MAFSLKVVSPSSARVVVGGCVGVGGGGGGGGGGGRREGVKVRQGSKSSPC